MFTRWSNNVEGVFNSSSNDQAKICELININAHTKNITSLKLFLISDSSERVEQDQSFKKSYEALNN